MPADEKSLAVGHKRKYLNDCIDSDISFDGTFIMGYTSLNVFKIFKFDGTCLVDQQMKDISNCYFSKGGKLAIVTFGSSKETSVTIYSLLTLDVRQSLLIDFDSEYWIHEER